MNVQSEARIERDFYCIFKDAIIEGITLNSYSVIGIEPQLRLAKREIADLVIIAEAPYKRKEVLLVLEVKRRPKTVTSYITGVKQALKYAKALDALFFAVCDDWFMLPFRSIINKLVGGYGVEMNKYYAQNLLYGLIEYISKEKSDYLNNLPKAPDPFYLTEKLFPSPAFTKLGVNTSKWHP